MRNPLPGTRLNVLLALGMVTWNIGTAAPGTPPAQLTLYDSEPAVVVHSAPSNFNHRVLVVDEGGFRSMRFGDINGVDQSRILPGAPTQLPVPYLRSAAAGLAVPRQLDRVLVIGLGGGALPSFVRALYPQAHVDAVEIDPVVARLAIEFFDLSENDRLKIHVMDAVDFVKQEQQTYDYILLDAYSGAELPDALISYAFLRNVHARLAPGGVAVANIAFNDEIETRMIINKLAGLFESCLHLRSEPSLNNVLLLSDVTLPNQDELIAKAQQLQTDEATLQGMAQHIHAARECNGILGPVD